MINTEQINLGRKGVIQLTFLGHSPPLREVLTGAQAGTEAETMEKHCPLVTLAFSLMASLPS